MMRVVVLAMVWSIAGGLGCGLLFGQPGQSLRGSLVDAAGCVSADGVNVKAFGGGNIYTAPILNGQFIFVRPQVLNGNAPYQIFIQPGQRFKFEQEPLVGPVSVYSSTKVQPQPCTKVVTRRYVQSEIRLAGLRPLLPFPEEPEDSGPQGSLPAARQFSFKVKTSTASGQSPSASIRSWLNRTSATIFAIEGNHLTLLDKIAPAADGSLSVNPEKYAVQAPGRSFLVSFAKPGFDSDLRPVRTLAELANSTVTLQRTDTDAHPPAVALNQNDPTRGRSSLANEIDHLPISGRRSVDALALLNPGVVPAPMAGTACGPGIGPTIGSAGEVAVNGLRPRLNNFVTDGADNNDEAVGVRRQGFVFPGPYVLESIREFQLLTALYDARFGRGSGGQFNLLTRVGTPVLHGSAYGYWSDARISSRNYFNADYSHGMVPGSTYYKDGVLQQERYAGGAKDPRTNSTAGLLLGTPIGLNTQLSLNAEWRQTQAQQTSHFSVPTTAERGFAGTGEKGFLDPGTLQWVNPSSQPGDAVFSLFPFPNNPAGPYGANTFTRVLPADERGLLYSVKLDRGFHTGASNHNLAGAFSGTTESNTLPVTGGALYSTLSPNLHTYSGTIFLDSNMGANSANGLRFAIGQANFAFGRVQDPMLQPSGFGGDPFLLNQSLLINQSNSTAKSYDGRASYSSDQKTTTESVTGLVGEINVAGYSGLGVDVFRFPQVRRDRTIQVSDSFTHFYRGWTLVGGVDYWNFRFNSTINPNALPYLQYNGQINASADPRLPQQPNHLGQPADLVAMGLPALDLQTLTTTSNNDLSLHRNQVDLFMNASGKLTSQLSLTVGVRIEFNRLPTSSDGRFETAFDQKKFNSQITAGRAFCLSLSPQLADAECEQRVDALASTFVGNYDSVFSANRLTVDPRVGLAWTPGAGGRTVIRAGFGEYTTQFPAVILDESRSVFPLSYTLNFVSFGQFTTNGPTTITGIPTRNSSPSNLLPANLGADPVAYLSQHFNGSSLVNTRPSDHLFNPRALHYGLTLEQAIPKLGIASVGYVATSARHLLRMTAPAQPGFAYSKLVTLFSTTFSTTIPGTPAFETTISGRTNECYYIDVTRVVTFGCAQVSNLFLETGASSVYHSLQTELRGHYRRAQYGSALTWGHSIDDASDFFDTRSSFALPQDSFHASANRASSDFDTRFRWVAYFDWQPVAAGSHGSLKRLFEAWRLSGIYTLQSGMPFTANTVYDSNRDGLLNDGLATAYGLDVNHSDRRLRLSLKPGFQIFQFVPQGIGAVGRNTFTGPGLNDLDLSVGRSFSLGDRQLTARLEGFNVLNHPLFGMPVRLLGAPGFGTSVDTAASNRRLQLNVQFSF